NRRTTEPLARAQHRAREMRMVGRIGVVRGLQAKCAAPLIEMAALADVARRDALEVVAPIEHQARLGTEHFHDAAGHRFVQPCGQPQPAKRLVYPPVMVVADMRLEKSRRIPHLLTPRPPPPAGPG